MQYYVRSAALLDIDAFLDDASDATASALYPKSFRLWALDKWNGPEESASEQLLVEGCHRLLSRSWPHFMVALALKFPNAPEADARSSGNDGAGSGAGVAQSVDAIVLHCPEAAIQLLNAKMCAGEAGRSNDHGKNHVLAAGAFLAKSEPTALTSMVVWRLFVHIPQTVMKRYLYIGSRPFERKEQAKAVRAHGQAPSTSLTRDYPVVIAARGDVENQAKAKCIMLMKDPTLYMLVPIEDVTNHTRAVAFLAGTAILGLLSKNFTQPHGKQPFTSFLWLLDPAQGEHLDAEKECMRCPWSRGRAKKGFFKNDDGRMSLLMLATILQVQNSLCENNNAWIHRLLNSRVQAKPMGLEDLNVAWLAHVAKRQSAGIVRAKKIKQEPTMPHKRQRKRGAGGAWRAFVRENASTDLRRVGELYRNLDDDERSRLRAEGAEATVAGRSGYSFGPKRRTAVRAHAVRI